MITATIEYLPAINHMTGGSVYVVAYVAAMLVIAASLFTLAHDLAGAARFATLTSNTRIASLFIGTDPASKRGKIVYRSTLVFCFYLAIPCVAFNAAYVAYGRHDITAPQLCSAIGIAAVGALMILFRPVQAICSYVRWLEAELLAQNKIGAQHLGFIECRQPIVAPTPAMAQTLRGAAASIASATSPVLATSM
jgi:hypothetical protein